MFVWCKSEQIRRCSWTLAALFARLDANMFNVLVGRYLFSCCELHLHKERERGTTHGWLQLKHALNRRGETRHVSIRMRIWSGWWEGLSTVVSNILRIRFFFTFSQFRLRDQTDLWGGKSKYQKNNCESSVFLSSSRAYWSTCDAQIFWLIGHQNKINQSSSELLRVYILSRSDLNVLGARWRKTAAQIL